VTGRRVVSAVAAFGLVGVGSVGLVTTGQAAPAQAFAGSCAATTPAATLVADNVCEVRITSSQSFTVPSGITKLAAVLVAGGAGAESNGTSDLYAGSGGAVVYVDSLPLGAPLNIVVGAGGGSANTTGSASAPGGDTTVGAAVATGGTGTGPFDPNCNDGVSHDYFSKGARTLGVGDPTCASGLGFTLAQLSGVDAALFPAAANGTASYGDGGVPGATATFSTVAGHGGDAKVVPDGEFFTTQQGDGAAGLVILRFAGVPTLAATGSSVSWTAPAVSAGMVALGALLVVFRRRHATR
jgi:LPXTG-motif cell wall-anchored protein